MKHSADSIVQVNLNIKPLEKVLVVTDTRMLKFGKLIYDASRKINLETTLMVTEPTGRHGAEPNEIVADAMKKSDVVIAPTAFSISHTKARREATEAGARIATMPNVSMISFTKGGLTADYTKIRELSQKMHERMKDVEEIQLSSKSGTQVRMSVKGRKWEKDDGFIVNPSDFGNLPAGEVETAPIEGTTEGKVVFDIFSDFTKKIELNVKNGEVEKTNYPSLEKIFSQFPKARNIGEIGIGTNPKSQLIQNVLEYEKMFGTVHLALGNNMSYGGKVDVPFHEDGLILKPTLVADGKTIIKNGKWAI
jgi:leucyl aminopeptidase (aminopeptidase T)